ncbi:hypothetical protein F4803DRAFT_467241 [Xylaria telfairii]|nr:hypothetical protein F4803DRAFT_467241 [Xylaria telfairii]
MWDDNCPGHEIHTTLKLEQFFAQYPIKAIGQHGRHTEGHPMNRCRLYFYVSFSNADKLAIFIKDNDQRPLRYGRQLKVFQHTDKPVDRNCHTDQARCLRLPAFRPDIQPPGKTRSLKEPQPLVGEYHGTSKSHRSLVSRTGSETAKGGVSDRCLRRQPSGCL